MNRVGNLPDAITLSSGVGGWVGWYRKHLMSSDSPLWLSDSFSRTVDCVGMAVPRQHPKSADHPLWSNGLVLSCTVESDPRPSLARPLLMTARSCASFAFFLASLFFLAFLLAVLKRLLVELNAVEGGGISEYTVADGGSSLSAFDPTISDDRTLNPLRRRVAKTGFHPDSRRLQTSIGPPRKVAIRVCFPGFRSRA